MTGRCDTGREKEIDWFIVANAHTRQAIVEKVSRFSQTSEKQDEN